MKTKLTPLALAFGFIFSSSVFAQDFIAQPNAAAPVDIQISVPVVPTDAPTLEVVTELTEKPFKQTAAIDANYVSAGDQIQDVMSQRGWGEGWDEKKQRIFVLVEESFDTEPPAYDDSFIAKRAMFATLATMTGKAKLVEFMRTQMSAVDQMTAPGTDVFAQLNDQYIKLEKKLNYQTQELAKLMAQVDQAEADKLAGITWNDLHKSLVIAAIKRLDAAFNEKAIEAAKQEKYEKLKAEYDAALAEHDSLKAQAEAVKGAVKMDASSQVATLAKAPIMGAQILIQAEAYNAEEGRYEVASLMVWSPKLEAAARAIALGEASPIKPKNAPSVQDWLKTQELATLIGPRQHIDHEGNRWFIGAFAMPAEGSSSTIRKNKGIADLMAQKEAVMSLYSDIETQKQAAIAIQTRNSDLGGKDHTEVATSFAESTRQSIENRQVNGISKLISKTVTHPISGQKVYVVAYGVSGNSAAQALKMEMSTYNTAAQIATYNNQNSALKAQYDAKLEQVKATPQQALSVSQSQGAVSAAPSMTGQSGASSSGMINAPTIDEDDF